MSLPWFRLFGETVDDGKLRLLAFEDRWHFIAILCCKCQGVLDSTRPELLDRVMAAKLGLALRDLDEVRRRLVEVGLIAEDWQPLGWEKRQVYSDHSGAERMRRYRAKNGAAVRNVSVTSPLRNSDVPDTDTDTDTDQNKKIGANAPASSGKKTASRIPEDFELTVERHAYAVKELPRVDAPSLFAEFVDHWKAASGATARKADWDATWRTWVRRAARYGYPMVHEAQVSQKQIRFDANGRQISG